jgi:hypothetical protein
MCLFFCQRGIVITGIPHTTNLLSVKKGPFRRGMDLFVFVRTALVELHYQVQIEEDTHGYASAVY